MGIISIIIKGLASAFFGPTASVIWTITDWVTGQKSGFNATVSLILNGVFDSFLDAIDFGYFADTELDEIERELVVAATNSIVDYGVDRLLNNFEFEQLSSGLITPKAVKVSLDGNTPHINEIWKKDTSSGLYLSPEIDYDRNLSIPLRNFDHHKFQSRELGGKLHSRKLNSRKL